MLLHQPSGEHPPALILWNTAQLMGGVFDRHLEAAGGNRYWYFLLGALAERPGTSQSELAHAVGVDATTMTYHLRVMEREQLIERVRAEGDRRVHRITVLPKGVELRIALNHAVNEYNLKQFAGISDEEIAVLIELVTRVEQNARRMEPADAHPVSPRARQPSSSAEGGGRSALRDVRG